MTNQPKFIHPSVAAVINAHHDMATPFLASSTMPAVEAIELFRKELPNVALYYAYKCANDPKFISSVEPYLNGFDIASDSELKALMGMDVDPNRILFSSAVKIPAHIESAVSSGVTLFAYQSADEIDKLSRLAPGARVLLRIRIPDEANSTGQKFAEKFGASVDEAVSLLIKARDNGLHPIGLAFHVGSQTSSVSMWDDAIRISSRIIEGAGAKGINLAMLNIGGGFPANYGSSPIHPFLAVAQTIRESLKLHIPTSIRVVAEPGRFIAAETSALVSSVIGVEKRGSDTWLFLDVGVFHGLMETFEFHTLLQPVMTLEDKPRDMMQYVLAGPTCDGDDIIARGVELPRGIGTDDKLVFGLSGAYVATYATSFNGIEPPKIVY